jgi:hypothetical protein
MQKRVELTPKNGWNMQKRGEIVPKNEWNMQKEVNRQNMDRKEVYCANRGKGESVEKYRGNWCKRRRRRGAMNGTKKETAGGMCAKKRELCKNEEEIAQKKRILCKKEE